MNTTTQTRFSELRRIMRKVIESIKYGYLNEDEFRNERDKIIETDSGYYAHDNNCIDVEGEIYHSEIDSDEYIIDDITGEYVLTSNSVEVNNGRHTYFVHENNANSVNDIYYFHGQYVDQHYIDRNGLVWCEDSLCYESDVYYWESDGEYHFEPEENSRLIHSYSYKPNPEFFKLSFENNRIPFFGIELEVERKSSSDISHDEMVELIDDGMYYFKSDGSLNDGFEIVTHPLSFNYIHNSQDIFKNMLQQLQKNGYNSYDANTCGMHIHISKNAFSTWHFYRFLKFFVENKEFIVSISQRKLDKLQKWANIEENTNDELIYKAKKKFGNSSRYVAINLSNSHTIEIRIFRGTLNFNSFMKNIEFVHALYSYTMESNECTMDGLKKYLATTCEYPNFKKFLKLKNL